jgi:hypothetical protein
VTRIVVLVFLCSIALSQVDGSLVLDGIGGVFLGTTRYEDGNQDVWLQPFAADSQPAAGWPAGGFRVTFDGAEKPALVMTGDGSGGG